MFPTLTVRTLRASIILALTAIASMPGFAQLPIETQFSLSAGAGSSDFSPYYIASNRHATVTQSGNTLLQAAAQHRMDSTSRFSWGAGIELWGGWASTADYQRYNSEGIKVVNPQHPGRVWLQQLYGEVKWRSLFFSLGMKQRESALLNFALSSGDLVESGNARPIPQARAGLIDFQDVPFTKGWLQIQGELAYGKYADNKWLENHYNYDNWHLNKGAFYVYRRLYFRVAPRRRLSLTLGMQAAGQIGGNTSWWNKGGWVSGVKNKASLFDLIKMAVPVGGNNGGSEYYDGNNLGSWDILARYKFASGHVLKAYLQKPWEKGSGIGWANGFDGVWGLEYKSPAASWIDGVVIEYIDFTNQSGPIHWSPGDSPGTTITTNSNGGEQYYNNNIYNSYANYGMSIGTPFLPAPIYNLDGYMAYVDNRVRGFHVGVNGTIMPRLTYRILASFRKSWGDGRIPRSHAVDCTSWMIEGSYHLPPVPGLSVNLQLAMDRGNMLGNRFGTLVTFRYNRIFEKK